MSYQVIARKYRPQAFDEVVGQPLVTGTLKNAIQNDRVAHGYIFSGARGVGKTTTARILAKCLNCVLGPAVSPCGECPSCREIAAGNSVDVFEIDAASNRGIDEIRELREAVRYLPARDRHKIFIIDEAHMLTPEAFNALLKTLEEPPPRSLFILATTEPHKLPATIQSRCQHFAFRLLEYGEIHSRLAEVCAAENIRAQEGALSVLAQSAAGSLRDALSLLDQGIAACGEELTESQVRQLLGVVPSSFLREMLEAIDARDARQVLAGVGKLAAEGCELAHFAAEFTRYIRNLMIAKSCGAESPLLQAPNDERQTLAELARLFSEEDLTRYFQILLRTEAELRYALEPRFHLEMGLLKLVQARKLGSLESLLAELRSSASEKPSLGPARGAASASRQTAEDTPPRKVRAQGSAEPLPGDEESDAVRREVRGRQPDFEPHLRTPSSSTDPEDARLSAIKALAFDQHKLLSSCLEPAVGWRFENGEVRFIYPRNQAFFVEILKSREQQEKLRTVCEQVLGQPVKIHVTLEELEGTPSRDRANARERAGRDTKVEAFRREFDCTWVYVQDLSQE